MAEVGQVVEGCHNQVDGVELLVRVGQFFLIQDQGLTAEFVGQFLQVCEGGDAVDGFSGLQI